MICKCKTAQEELVLNSQIKYILQRGLGLKPGLQAYCIKNSTVQPRTLQISICELSFCKNYISKVGINALSLFNSNDELLLNQFKFHEQKEDFEIYVEIKELARMYPFEGLNNGLVLYNL